MLLNKARNRFSLIVITNREVKLQRVGAIVGNLRSTKSFNACTHFVNLEKNAANPEVI